MALMVIVISGNLLREQSNTIFQTGSDITINGQVNSFFRQITHGYEGTISIRSINGQTLGIFLRPKVRLIAPLPLKYGDVAEFSITVKPIFGRLNETGFDAEAYSLSQGIVARATVNNGQSYRIESLPEWRAQWYQKIKTWLADDPNLGILMALTFGERSDISTAQWKALRDSGLIHLVAISGLHIGIAFGFGYSPVSYTHLTLPTTPYV